MRVFEIRMLAPVISALDALPHKVDHYQYQLGESKTNFMSRRRSPYSVVDIDNYQLEPKPTSIELQRLGSRIAIGSIVNRIGDAGGHKMSKQ